MPSSQDDHRQNIRNELDGLVDRWRDAPAIDLDSEEEDSVESERPRMVSSIAGKRPRSILYASEDDDEGLGVDTAPQAPDLEGYFDELGISVRERILLCRSYASYLASKERSMNKKKK